jgi:hypothetical protein
MQTKPAGFMMANSELPKIMKTEAPGPQALPLFLIILISSCQIFCQIADVYLIPAAPFYTLPLRNSA